MEETGERAAGQIVSAFDIAKLIKLGDIRSHNYKYRL
jgi:hypothetical protein